MSRLALLAFIGIALLGSIDAVFTDDDVARYILSCFSFSGVELQPSDSVEPGFCAAFSDRTTNDFLYSAVLNAFPAPPPRANQNAPKQDSDEESPSEAQEMDPENEEEDPWTFLSSLATSETPDQPPSHDRKDQPFHNQEPLVAVNGLCVREPCPFLGNVNNLLVAQGDAQEPPQEQVDENGNALPLRPPQDTLVADAGSVENPADVDAAVGDMGFVEKADESHAAAQGDEGHYHPRRHRRHRHHRPHRSHSLDAADELQAREMTHTEDDAREGNPLLPAVQRWTAGRVPWNFVPAAMTMSPGGRSEEVHTPPAVAIGVNGVRVNTPKAMMEWEKDTCIFYDQQPATATNRFLFISAPRSTQPAGVCETRWTIANDPTTPQVIWMSDPAIPAVWNYDPAGGAGSWQLSIPGASVTLESDWWFSGNLAPHLQAALQHAFGCHRSPGNVAVTRITGLPAGVRAFRVVFTPPSGMTISAPMAIQNPASVSVTPIVGVANAFRIQRVGASNDIQFSIRATLPTINSNPLSPGQSFTEVQAAMEAGAGRPIVTVSAAVAPRSGFDITFDRPRFKGMNVPLVITGGAPAPAAPTRVTAGSGSNWPEGCRVGDAVHELGHGLLNAHTQMRRDFADRTGAATSTAFFRFTGTCPLDSQYQVDSTWTDAATFPGKSNPQRAREELARSIMLYETGVEVNDWAPGLGTHAAEISAITTTLTTRRIHPGKIDLVLLNRHFDCFPIPFANSAAPGGIDRLWAHRDQDLGVFLSKFIRTMLSTSLSIRFVPNARQSIAFTAAPTANRFTLTVDTFTSPNIDFTTNLEQLSLNIRDGLTDISTGREVFTTVSGGRVHVTFLGRQAGGAVALMRSNSGRANIRRVVAGGAVATVRDKFAVGRHRSMRTEFGMTQFGSFAAVHAPMTISITVTLQTGAIIGSSLAQLIEPNWTLEEFTFVVQDRLEDLIPSQRLGAGGLTLNGVRLSGATSTLTSLGITAGVTVTANL